MAKVPESVWGLNKGGGDNINVPMGQKNKAAAASVSGIRNIRKSVNTV